MMVFNSKDTKLMEVCAHKPGKKRNAGIIIVMPILACLLSNVSNPLRGQTPDEAYTDERVSFNGTYHVLSVSLGQAPGGHAASPFPAIPIPGARNTAYNLPRLNIKTNVLYALTLTPNIALELGLGRKSTLDISAGYNFYHRSGRQWRHWLVQPEYRYWFCERFNGLFVGGHLLGGQFNFSNIDFPLNVLPALRYSRYEGDYFGAGIVVGHQWILGKHWSFEAAAGVGYARVAYDRYDCDACGPPDMRGKANYFGPTKAAASFIYFF